MTSEESQPARDAVPLQPSVSSNEPTTPDTAPVKTGAETTLVDAMRNDWAPPPRRVALPLALFVATCGTTFVAGACNWAPAFVWSFELQKLWNALQANWWNGLVYMAGVMLILLCHEMGHFLMTVRHRVHASWPFFLPVPMLLTGTMGAVIGMEHSKANRKELFDIGIAGPLAGLVPTLALTIVGVLTADYQTFARNVVALEYGDPLLVTLLIDWLRPDVPDGAQLIINPIYMAGWVGMLVTGLNMMPVSQLDGGHVTYAVFGRRGAHLLARAFVLSAAAYMLFTGNYQWLLMLLLVMAMGVDHPRTSDDSVRLGWFRRTLGFASLAIPVLCFIPTVVQPVVYGIAS